MIDRQILNGRGENPRVVSNNPKGISDTTSQINEMGPLNSKSLNHKNRKKGDNTFNFLKNLCTYLKPTTTMQHINMFYFKKTK